MANYIIRGKFSSVQSLNRVQFFAIPWTAAWQGSLSFTIFWNLLTLISIELVMPSNHLILCHHLLLLLSVFLLSIFPSIRVFSNESSLHIRGTVGGNVNVIMENSMAVHQKMTQESLFSVFIYPREMKTESQRNICNSMSIAALFATVKLWKQLKCCLLKRE